ncbi:unnamed protein product [Paramecium primaurelia]|uniref:Uncharacterized protein n=2 Tax=Paramecium TaxID=5884 RepID=A0A8S1WZN0_9CILI|nr:unnamed protein product [Paramecium primaurelia]CAD8193629.1 unnamed protein product [Paramecium pentaurelia]
MGTCAAQKQKRSTNDGQLQQVVAQVRLSQDCNIILKQRASQSSHLNPYKNPILNRRLKEIPTSPNPQTQTE